MYLQLSTWQEIDTYLESSSAVLVPIGSTEQHGPTGFVGTDALCPEIIARGLSEKVGALIAPTLSIGMAQHHLGFSGSLTLRPSTLISVIQDVVNSFARHGFDRIMFLNGHGGNIATVQAAFAEIYAESSLGTASPSRPDLQLKLQNWFTLPSVLQLSDDLYGEAEGSHATPTEISLTYFAYPEHRKNAPLTPKRAPTGPIQDAADYRRRFPDGRIGAESALANPADGKKIYETALADLIGVWKAFAAR
jgi:creatinine amidohydrolase|tara:strand:+ start:15088 stop:15834 length:747 start_codon:yes stop_codon:yes gene_type:complete